MDLYANTAWTFKGAIRFTGGASYGSCQVHDGGTINIQATGTFPILDGTQYATASPTINYSGTVSWMTLTGFGMGTYPVVNLGTANVTIASGYTLNGYINTFTNGAATIIGGTVHDCRFETGMTFTNVTLGENVVVSGTATVNGTTHGSLKATRVNVQSSNAAALALTATDIYVCTTAAVNLTGSTGAIHLLAPGLPYTVASGLTVDALIPLGVIEVG
jgi:hypothetical protein